VSEDRDRVEHMLQAIEGIQRYARDGHERFERDELVQVYCLHQLMILGEAASRLSPELRDAYAEIPWGSIIGLRNVLVHGYFAVGLNRVWGVIETDLAPLAEQLGRIMDDLGLSQTGKED